jgi:hypothetical protein
MAAIEKFDFSWIVANEGVDSSLGEEYSAMPPRSSPTPMRARMIGLKIFMDSH